MVIVRKRRNGDQNNDNSRCREASIMTPCAEDSAHYSTFTRTAAGGCAGQDVVGEQREKFAMALIRQVCYCSVQHRISRLIGRNYASSYLVHHCRFSCRLRRESTTAYTSVDHMDSRARYCRLNYRRSSHAFVLPAERGR